MLVLIVRWSYSKYFYKALPQKEVCVWVRKRIDETLGFQNRNITLTMDLRTNVDVKKPDYEIKDIRFKKSNTMQIVFKSEYKSYKNPQLPQNDEGLQTQMTCNKQRKK